jgi:hypothetical protein
LLQVHLAAIYVMIGLTMLAGETWWVGDALWWLMAHAESRLVDLTALGRSEGGRLFINLLTHGIVAFMLLYGLLVWHRLARPILVFASFFVWTLLGLLTGLISYALLMIGLNVLFAGSPFWQTVALRQRPLAPAVPAGQVA